MIKTKLIDTMNINDDIYECILTLINNKSNPIGCTFTCGNNQIAISCEHVTKFIILRNRTFTNTFSGGYEKEGIK